MPIHLHYINNKPINQYKYKMPRNDDNEENNTYAWYVYLLLNESLFTEKKQQKIYIILEMT